MSNSTLDPDNDFESDRKIGKGHGSDALGPSDSSDSGSDVADLSEEDGDSDRQNTGERASVVNNEFVDGQDIGFDRVDDVAGARIDGDSGDDPLDDPLDDAAAAPPRRAP